MFRKLFQALLHAFKEKVVATTTTTETVDPWSGSGGMYVARFRRHLDDIARLLSREGYLVRTRFSRQHKCVELYVHEMDICCQVIVHGCECEPYKAIVTDFSLSEEDRKFFIKLLPVRVEFETATA